MAVSQKTKWKNIPVSSQEGQGERGPPLKLGELIEIEALLQSGL